VPTDPDVRLGAPGRPRRDGPESDEPIREGTPVLRVSWLAEGPGWLPVWRALAHACDLSVWASDRPEPAHRSGGNLRSRHRGAGPVLRPGPAGELVSADVVVLACGPLPGAWQVLRAARARGTATVALAAPGGGGQGGLQGLARRRLLRSVDAVLAAGPAAVGAVLASGVPAGCVVETLDPVEAAPDAVAAMADDALDAIRLAWLTRQFWVKRPLLY
jgi:hypothetical protein